ncbi:CobW family GTP-binding protein [Limoniibacter endophyticus]|uniref:ATP-binding protein n=1 Tax=Limoniibacter endophyticus TaxID=1565040 RepID=A0A8J3DRC6_9HYPH|nr:GTP-binding protein [Limoniibacter endophyticus]GHC76440.1 ATP-binding protein [Limoniibacter endophyticus]
MNEPVPVSILTGFLGAGKTTLLNRLLNSGSLSDCAVIINEFGSVSLDHLLVEQANENIVELPDGCVCCVMRGALVDTLADLLDRAQTRRIPRLSRIVIETTGLADPSPVLKALMGHPVLMGMLRLDGVIALVDAVNGSMTLAKHEEARRQVAVADRILISKTDLIADDAVLATLKADMRALNPRAAFLDMSDVVADKGLVSCGPYNLSEKDDAVREWLGEKAEHDHAPQFEHDHHAHHHHDHAHSHIQTISLVHDGAVSFGVVDAFLGQLRAIAGDHLLRLKGLVETMEHPERPLVVHGVQSLFHPPVRLERWPDSSRGTRMVVIMDGGSLDEVKRTFLALFGTPQIDMADHAALSDNPLAIAGFTVR